MISSVQVLSSTISIWGTSCHKQITTKVHSVSGAIYAFKACTERPLSLPFLLLVLTCVIMWHSLTDKTYISLRSGSIVARWVNPAAGMIQWSFPTPDLSFTSCVSTWIVNKSFRYSLLLWPPKIKSLRHPCNHKLQHVTTANVQTSRLYFIIFKVLY